MACQSKSKKKNRTSEATNVNIYLREAYNDSHAC